MLVVDVMGKVDVDLVCADVGVLGRVYPREVLVFEENWAICAGEIGVRAKGLCKSWRGVGW